MTEIDILLYMITCFVGVIYPRCAFLGFGASLLVRLVGASTGGIQ